MPLKMTINVEFIEKNEEKFHKLDHSNVPSKSSWYFDVDKTAEKILYFSSEITFKFKYGLSALD